MTVTVRELPSQNAANILLAMSIVIELINASIPLVLVIPGWVGITPTIVVASTAVPRAIIMFLLSLFLAPGLAWWTQWRKIGLFCRSFLFFFLFPDPDVPKIASLSV